MLHQPKPILLLLPLIHSNTEGKIVGCNVRAQDSVAFAVMGMHAVKGVLTELKILQSVAEAFLRRMQISMNVWQSLTPLMCHTLEKIVGCNVTVQDFVAIVELGMHAVKGLLTEQKILQSAAKASLQQTRISMNVWKSLPPLAWNTLEKIVGCNVTVRDFVIGVGMGMLAVKGLLTELKILRNVAEAFPRRMRISMNALLWVMRQVLLVTHT